MARGQNRLSGDQRQLVIGACLISGAAQVSLATFNFVVDPMVSDFNATETQQSLLRQLPAIGALLVIFVAGVLGLRVGARRFLSLCGALMAVGYGIVTISPGINLAEAGLVLGSIGRQGAFVTVVGVLALSLRSDDERASGFSAYAAVTPLVFLVFPPIAGGLVETLGWRWVLLVWVLSGLAAVAAAVRLVPHDGAPQAPNRKSAQANDGVVSVAPGELWTPALAGFLLACLVQILNNGSTVGWSDTKTLAWFGLAVISAALLWVLMRRIAHPTLDIEVLRKGGLRLLLLAFGLLLFTNLWFYMTVGLQYIYGYSALQTALLMMPPQAAGIVGAAVASRLIKRRGLTFAGIAALVGVAAALFLCTFQTVTLPVWVPLGVLCLYSAALTAATIPLTNSIMNLAAPGSEGSVSAYRGASANLGAALGVVVITAIVFGTFQSSLSVQMSAIGENPSQAAQISDALRSGLTSEEVSSQYSVPLNTVTAVDDAQKQAMVDAYRNQGIFGGVVVLLAAGAFLAGSRSNRDEI